MTQTETAVVRRQRIVAEPLGHVPALDGLRAFAVIAVVLYHSRFSWIPGGFLGVSAFFTLSGFLITSLILREWTESDGVELRSFWRRRFRRLLPASWATLALIVVLGAVGAWSDGQLRKLASDVPFSLAEVVNWHFIAADRSYGAALEAPSPVEHFWSLAVEQQFYVLLPALVVAVLCRSGSTSRRRRLQRLTVVLGVLVVISAIANGVLARASIERAYYGTDTRMAEMLIGALLACWTLRRLRLPATARIRGAVAVVGVVAGCLSLWLWHASTLGSMWLYPWGLLLTAICTACVIYAAVQKGKLATVLSVAPLLWIGRLSYGIYLLHWPVFLVLTPARVGWAPWPLFALRMAVTVTAALLLHRVVEQPIRSGRRLRPPAGLVVALLVVPAIIAVNVVVTATAAPPTRLQQALADPTPPSTITATPVRTLVIGDEFAASVGAALDPADVTEISVASVPTCGLALGGWVMTAGGDVELDVDRCRRARSEWVATAESTRPDVVLMVPGLRDVADRRMGLERGWAGPTEPVMSDFLAADIGSLVEELSRTAGQVVVATVPYMRNTVVPTPQPLTLTQGEPGTSAHSFAEVAAELISEGAHAHFAENDDARIDALNAMLRSVAVARGAHVVDLAAHVDGWPEGPFDPDARPGGVGLAGPGAIRVADWLAPMLAELRPLPRAAPAPPAILDAGAPLPPAPPVIPRRRLEASHPPTALVVGDSVAADLVLGLSRSSSLRPDRPVEIHSGAMPGCPLARGGSYRVAGDIRLLDDGCSWADSYPQLVAAHRPDLVVVSAGAWEVADRRFPGDDAFRHIGDPGVDRYLLREYLTAVDTLSVDGAVVVLVLQPRVQIGLAEGLVDLPESDPARTDRLNEIYREVASLRPGVVQLVDLGEWLRSRGAETEPAVRPDGLHFSDEYSELAGDWLALQIWNLAHAD